MNTEEIKTFEKLVKITEAKYFEDDIFSFDRSLKEKYVFYIFGYDYYLTSNNDKISLYIESHIYENPVWIATSKNPQKIYNIIKAIKEAEEEQI